MTAENFTPAKPSLGARLLRELVGNKPDSYQPNPLPPLDTTIYTEEDILQAQKRALIIEEESSAMLAAATKQKEPKE